MKKALQLSALICIGICLAGSSSAQAPGQRTQQIALFTPLYLDSAFDATMTYRYGNTFPKYLNAGLEFYEGAQLAIDSLEKQGVSMNVHVFDTRSSASSVPAVIRRGDLDSIDLIIGHVNAQETKMLADAAAAKKITFVNATYPNDAGVTNNPHMLLLNSTLATHCSAIYKFIQKQYALAPVVMFRKEGRQEDRLRDYFDEISKGTSSVPLKIKYVTLPDDFDSADVAGHLDAEATTVCIAGSLDISFGERVMSNLATLSATRPTLLFAMPTWWEATNFNGRDFKGVEVIYTTPFYMAATDPEYMKVQQNFRSQYASRPTDMVFRGYETMFHFASLLRATGRNLGSSLSDKRFHVFTEFGVEPVLNRRTNTLDYFENKKIFYIKKLDGAVIGVY